MELQIQDLVSSIRKDGIDAANAEAEAIITEAKKKAEEIIAKLKKGEDFDDTVDGISKDLAIVDIKTQSIKYLIKSIIYVILFMSLVLIISLVISSISSLKKSPKELLIDTK